MQNPNPNDYRVGDKVLIAPEEFLKSKGIELAGETNLLGTDRVVELRGTYPNGCWMACKEIGCGVLAMQCHFDIPESAILGHSFKWGEKIEVSDDGNSWFPETFGTFSPCKRLSVYSNGGVPYRYARPIREKEEEKPQEPETPPRFKAGTWVTNTRQLVPYEVVERSLYSFRGGNVPDTDWWAERGYKQPHVGWDESDEYIEIPAPPTEEQQKRVGYRTTGRIVDVRKDTEEETLVFHAFCCRVWEAKQSFVGDNGPYRWEAEEIEEEQHKEPEVFWGDRSNDYNVGVYSCPDGLSRHWINIAAAYQKDQDWAFVGFYRTNVGPDSLPGKGSPTPFYHGLGGEILVKPFAKFVRREKP
jgi:hypothetical protein